LTTATHFHLTILLSRTFGLFTL